MSHQHNDTECLSFELDYNTFDFLDEVDNSPRGSSENEPTNQKCSSFTEEMASPNVSSFVMIDQKELQELVAAKKQLESQKQQATHITQLSSLRGATNLGFNSSLFLTPPTLTTDDSMESQQFNSDINTSLNRDIFKASINNSHPIDFKTRVRYEEAPARTASQTSSSTGYSNPVFAESSCFTQATPINQPATFNYAPNNQPSAYRDMHCNQGQVTSFQECN